MASTPTHKNLSALIEQPTSRTVRSDGSRTETRIYMATYAVCLAAIKVKGTAGTGDLTGHIIKESVVTRSKGEQGQLTDVWVQGGPDADPETIPVPPDTFSLVSQDLNPSVEKNQNLDAAGLDTNRYNAAGATGSSQLHKTLTQWAREAGLSTDSEESNVAWNALVAFVAANPSNAAMACALVIADLLRRGVSNYYKASFVYTWTQYFVAEPTITVGGYIQTPGGPLASAIAGLGLVAISQADDLNFDGQFYQLTNKWICAQDDHETFWEPILYT